MEQWVEKIIEVSPALGIMALLWWYQRKDYKELLNNALAENAKREENYQNTIDKLTDKLSVMETVKSTVDTIKTDLEHFKNKE